MRPSFVHWARPQSGTLRVKLGIVAGLCDGAVVKDRGQDFATHPFCSVKAPRMLQTARQIPASLLGIPLMPGMDHAGSTSEFWLPYHERRGPDSRDMKPTVLHLSLTLFFTLTSNAMFFPILRFCLGERMLQHFCEENKIL